MENEHKYIEKQWTFRDGVRTIDYVLVWDGFSDKATSKGGVEKRMVFENNLMEDGLELEHEYADDTELNFIKIHIPSEVLRRYAEIIKLRMPIKDLPSASLEGESFYKIPEIGCFKRCFSMLNCFEMEPNVFPECEKELSTAYSRALEYIFDVESPYFFTPAQKARVVLFVLERTLYSRDGHLSNFEFGIRRLVLTGIYSAAYPLHDGDLETPESMRYKFYHYWASFKNWYKKQPVDHIRQYFGTRTALYFLWLGYYTRMLIPASIVGVACFVGSFYLLPLSVTVDEVCDGEIKDVICPLCDRHCKLQRVTDTCRHTEILHIFDNATTVVFAIFMSFWAAIFLECWRRYSAETTTRWDLTSLDDRDENPRPEYAARLSKLAADRKVSHQLNFITNAKEPKVTFWKHIFPGTFLSLTTTLFLIALAIAAIISVILYRMLALRVLSSGLIVSVTATFLNLACILILSPIYAKLSLSLTDMEMARTQREFDNSLTVKLYLLEFINNYSSIFYIAFIKGKFVGPPSGYYRIFGFRQLECEAGGCMLELTQQLAIIMIGKRAFHSISQVIQPCISQNLKNRFSRLWNRDHEEIHQWEKDYALEEREPRLLFSEYLDMVLQYGFVTIFVSAFPLAPLFALINNIFEIRIDAQKLLIYDRRPTLRRIKDIGVWFDILHYVSKIAIFTNGYIIAFTSSIVPRIVYRLTMSPNFGTAGFLNHTLSYMAIKDLDMEVKPNTTVKYCRYWDYREPPWSEHKYEVTKMFWIVLAARLAFFIVFENVIMLSVVLVRWLIPDVPRNVRWQIRRKHYLLNEIIINREASLKKRKTVS